MKRSTRLRHSASLLVFVLGLALIVPATAQQPQTTHAAASDRRRGVAPPGINWPSPPLPDGPIMLQSAEPRSLRVVVMTKTLEQPWSLAFSARRRHARHRAARPHPDLPQRRARPDSGRRRAARCARRACRG